MDPSSPFQSIHVATTTVTFSEIGRVNKSENPGLASKGSIVKILRNYRRLRKVKRIIPSNANSENVSCSDTNISDDNSEEDCEEALINLQSVSRNTIECPICSEVAIDHLHYGGIGCYSCKAFFRRSVVKPPKKSKG